MKDLSDNSRKILTTTSIFEGEFSIDWILEATNFKASDILKALNDGETIGLLTKIDVDKYQFKDQEKRALFLKTLPEDEILLLHRTATKIVLSEVVEEVSRLKELSVHFLKVKNTVEGCRWLLWAGEKMFKEYGRVYAFRCYKKAVEDLKDEKKREVEELYIEAVIKYSLFIKNNFDSLKHDSELVEEALQRAEKWLNRPYQGRLLFILAIIKWYLNEQDHAVELFEKGVKTIKEIGEKAYSKEIASNQSLFYFLRGQFKKSIEVYEQYTPDIEESFNHPLGHISAMTVGLAYAFCGQVSHGLGIINAIHKYCQKIGLQGMVYMAEIYIGHIMLEAGRLKEALKYYQKVKEGMSIKPEDSLLLWKGLLLGIALANYQEEKYATSQKALKEFSNTSGDDPLTSLSTLFFIKLAWNQGGQEILKKLKLNPEQKIKDSLKSGNLFIKGFAYRYQAMEQKSRKEPATSIVRSLRKSIKLLDQSGHITESARSRLMLSQELLLEGVSVESKKLTTEINLLLSFINKDFIPRDLLPLLKNDDKIGYYLESIYAINEDFAIIRDEKEWIQKIINLIIQLTGAERGAAFLPETDESSAQFRMVNAKALPVEEVHSDHFRSSLDLIDRCYSARTMMAEESLSGHFSIGNKEDQIVARICIPMLYKKKIKGVLYFDNKLINNKFDSFDARLFSVFATRAAIAIDSLQTHQENEKLRIKLYNEQHFEEIKPSWNAEKPGIIGKSTKIRSVFKQIERVSPTDSSVLIFGETGVGKELVARAIHNESRRKNGPFVSVNSSALSLNLITSELFGHEKGAFTGANKQHRGRFELANRGTIFLDEIGDIPLELQIALLRVLQTQEFQRVGGTETIQSDFRLVAATNQDLVKKSQRGEFREDLYYRLNVFPILVPPLRERPEDIPLLITHFLQQYAAKSGKRFSRIRRTEIDQLIGYDWPGNVRELENMVERGVIMSPESDFRIPKTSPIYRPQSSPCIGTTLKEMEKNHILWALKQAGGKVYGKRGAAELLDLHPNTLHSKMKRLRIQNPFRKNTPDNSSDGE